ncbi:MAG: thioredoxin family protein [Leeuwenhoekiella sp.]
MEKPETTFNLEVIKETKKQAMAYAEYRKLVADHAIRSTSTGTTQTEALSEYTQLNDRRMRRWDKTFKIGEIEFNAISKIKTPQTWLVLTESWCGDAAPTLPVMNAIAQLNTNIDFKVVLRDDHPDTMQQFLTNGAMSIPKLVITDVNTETVLGTWGPRPGPLAQLVAKHKAIHGSIQPEFKEEVQRWYNKDKGQTTLKELIELSQNLPLK